MATPKLLAQNKKAYFDYEVLEKFEAGIKLIGPEVKSVKAGQLNLKGSFVTLHNGKPQVTNMHISPYKPAGLHNPVDPSQARELLLKKSEIGHLVGKLETKGLSAVPLEAYVKNGWIKLLIGVVKGKKQYEKRRVIKERETKKEAQRVMRGRMN